MGGLLSFAIAICGLLFVLGIGGAVWNLIGHVKKIKLHFDTLFNSLPMGREEVNDLSH